MNHQTFLPLLFVILFTAGQAPAATLYVDANGANPTAPFADWNTAATNIQDAVDAAVDGDLILVTNGVYATGGRAVYGALTNRVAVDKAVTVQSVNGPAATIIQGFEVPGTNNGVGAVRCAYLTNGAVLAGFTLTNGVTRSAGDRWYEMTGAGVWCESTNAVLTNCVLIANTAFDSLDGVGGGAFFGTLNGCALINNTAAAGGGAYNSTLNDCTLISNRVSQTVGGGAYLGALNRCLLTDNSAPNGGGASGCTLIDCTASNNVANGKGGAVYSSTLSNCLLVANRSSFGGGASYSTLSGCTVADNLAGALGGGVLTCTLNDCTVRNNSAASLGGGIYSGTSSNCLVTGNFSDSGGGANLGTLINCVLSGNTAASVGGGANSNTLINCALINNSAHISAGGASRSTLAGCTVTGNSAASAGGVDLSSLTNSIVYHNLAVTGANCSASNSLSYCCTTPLPVSGAGNIAADPQLADSFHLTAVSPCRAAGSAAYSTGADIDGGPWANPPAIGCDEFVSGSVTGPLIVAIQAVQTNLAAGFVADFTALITGRASSNYWDLGDGTRLTNRPSVSHGWPVAGDYAVRFVVFNDDYPNGVSSQIQVHVLDQPVQYVALSNATPVAPYLSWSTAAANIQDAVDAGFVGGTILVSNGVYRTGGRVMEGSLTNRLVVHKPVTVQSVNGPEVTVIEGYQVPGVINSNQAVRCVYLRNDSRLIGFTLTNGATRNSSAYIVNSEFCGGGVFCESTNVVVSNCVMVANSSSLYGAGACYGTLKNCQFNGNIAVTYGGGGAAFSVLADCTLTGNRASSTPYGGGAYACILSNCVLSANTNGGAKESILDHCVVTGNQGPGVMYGTASRCVISSNVVLSIIRDGGGAHQATLNDCVLFGNRATNGGGAFNCTMNNCVLSNNYASNRGGGIYRDNYLSATNTLGQNHTLMCNSAGQSGGGLYYSVVGPANTLTNWTFTGNTAASHGGGLYMAVASQGMTGCTFSGNSAGGSGGGLYLAAASQGMTGCTFSDNSSGGSGGGLYASFLSTASLTNCVFSGNSASSNGGGLFALGGMPAICTNCSFAGNFAGSNGGGAYNVELTQCTLIGNQAKNGGGAYGLAINDCVVSDNLAVTNGGGFLLASGTRPCGNCNFTNNSAGNGGGVYSLTTTIFSNCVFSGNSAMTNGGGFCQSGIGGLLKNCLMISNNAAFGGGGYNRSYLNCVISGNSATNSGGGIYALIQGTLTYMTNCTLSHNSAGTNGGGAYQQTMTNCLLFNNWSGKYGGGVAYSTLRGCALSNNWASYGGAAMNSTLTNCAVLNNQAATNGGGAFSSSMYNCLLTGNSARYGGGTYGGYLVNCTLGGNSATNIGGGQYGSGTYYNCIIYWNSAPIGPNYSGSSTYSWCCTSPLAPAGTGNFTNAPLFVDLAANNLRLQTGSPCINAGGGSPGSMDLDGRPRVVGGRIDIGAYEFQGAGMGEFTFWLQQYGLAANGSADMVDTDRDGLNNWQEWRASTVPTNALSVLKMLNPSPGVPGVSVSWQSVNGVNYFLERSADLAAPPAFSAIQSNLVGQAGTTTFFDAGAVGPGPFFYRIGVQ